MKEEFTKYEVARILGARALQIAMDAPLLVKISKEELEQIRYDPLRIAEIEFDADILPITVKRPFPKKRDMKIKKVDEKKKDDESEDREIEKKEEIEVKGIREEGEIMELARPEDETEEAEEEVAGMEE